MSRKEFMSDAKKNKNDEFYTRYVDIEKEVMHYHTQFENKIVLCNCDDPVESNFWQFFHRNFSFFKLKKLISTHYVENGLSYAMIYDGRRDNIEPLTRNDQIDNNEDMNLFSICNMNCSGDFRSEECLKYLEESDIVVTNPPFSLFREFISTLNKYNKKFLILGTMNAFTYGEVFSGIKENKIRIGYGFNESLIFKAPYKNTNEGNRDFVKSKGFNPDDGYVKVSGITWFTNLNTTKMNEENILYKEYNKEEYSYYDNFNAINVNKVLDIPCNYFGYIGVPVTYLGKHNSEQFDILGIAWDDNNPDIKSIITKHEKWAGPYVNGKKIYTRIFIRRKYDNNGLLVKDHYDIDGNFIK